MAITNPSKNWMQLALATEIRKRVPRLQFPNAAIKQQALILGKAVEVANLAYKPEMGSYCDFMARAVYLVLVSPDFKKSL